DAGKGLRAGQALVWADKPCYGDVFHILDAVLRLVTMLDKRACASIKQLEKLKKKMEKPVRTGAHYHHQRRG
ncbi:MAG: hypothetical protein GY862_35715, partial [Gammaproteobacteria bacterium]|nr:hypothetical protein [Gammaproteobacteria bacterium]